MRTNLRVIEFFLIMTGCNQNQSNYSNNSSFQNIVEEQTVINYCDCQVMHRDDGTEVTTCIRLHVGKDNSSEIGLSILSNG